MKPKLPQLQMWFPVKGEAKVICKKKLSNSFLVNSSRTVAPLFREAFPLDTYTIPALKKIPDKNFGLGYTYEFAVYWSDFFPV